MKAWECPVVEQWVGWRSEVLWGRLRSSIWWGKGLGLDAEDFGWRRGHGSEIGSVHAGFLRWQVIGLE